jgi:ADP-heptose:LPS heptosyltransferase
VLDRLPNGARVAIVRLRSLGDCVLTTPAIHILKRFRPDLRISVVVEDRFAAVFTGNPDVAEIVRPQIPAMVKLRPALCLNLHGGTRSMALTAASAARYRAGFAHHRGSAIYNIRIPTAQEILGVARKVHTAEHLASAVFHLGAPVREIPRARLFAAPPRRTRPYAVIHAMASAPEKTWPAERFLAIAELLRTSLDVVFLAGPGEDTEVFRRFECIAGPPLEEAKSLLSGASFFAGNDSGPAHMAAAFGVPLAVLFGPSDPVIWGPWQTAAEVLTGARGIESITVEEVAAAVEKLRVRI